MGRFVCVFILYAVFCFWWVRAYASIQKCSFCGRTNQNAALFCFNCGTKLSGAEFSRQESPRYGRNNVSGGVRAIGWTPARLSFFGSIGLPTGADFDVFGLDLSALWSDSPHVYGLQISGFASRTRWCMKGIELGVCNIASDEIYGAQIGVCNIAPCKINGVQIGLINYATDSSGHLQIGLVNITTCNKYKVLPLVNGSF